MGDVSAASVAKGNGTSPVALVAQEPILLPRFHRVEYLHSFGTVSQEQIEDASRAAHLHEDVVAMVAFL